LLKIGDFSKHYRITRTVL